MELFDQGVCSEGQLRGIISDDGHRFQRATILLTDQMFCFVAGTISLKMFVERVSSGTPGRLASTHIQ